jgi:uncharacterized protein YdhG (YjbR/CyaY superfamily)
MKSSKDIEVYIAAFSKPVQVLLRKLRITVRKAAPAAEERIAYGIPTYSLHGNLVHFGGFQNHISFFPGSPLSQPFKKELASYEVSKGTVRFPLDKALPLSLISRIVKYRVTENMTQAKAKAKSKGVHIVFHSDGSIWARGKLKGGKMDGYWEWFRKDGTIMRSGYFKRDIQTGKWTTYTGKGKVYKVTEMQV